MGLGSFCRGSGSVTTRAQCVSSCHGIVTTVTSDGRNVVGHESR